MFNPWRADDRPRRMNPLNLINILHRRELRAEPDLFDAMGDARHTVFSDPSFAKFSEAVQEGDFDRVKELLTVAEAAAAATNTAVWNHATAATLSDTATTSEAATMSDTAPTSAASSTVSEVAKLIHGTDDYGYTALSLAVKFGHLDIVELLITKYDANKDQTNLTGESPFWIAAQRGHLDVVKYLHLQGADVMKSDQKRAPPLLCAALHGFTSVVKYLCEHCSSDVNQGDVLGFLPLFFASQNGHAEIVQYLISLGAEVDKTNMTGASSLYTASLYRHIEVVRLLVSHGAVVDKASSQGLTALFAASWSADIDVVTFLVDNGADWNKSPAAGDRGGWTPLHAAARQNNQDVLKYLMEECGADLDARTAATAWMAGMTPSELAVNDEIKQAIDAEHARRNNHTFKRARVGDLPPPPAVPVTAYGFLARGRMAAEEHEVEDEEEDEDEDEEDDGDEEA